MKALKLLFFSDRFHLRKYGRPITNDEYFAMNYGPVPSGGKDLVEASDFRPDVEKAYAGQFIDSVTQYEFASIHDVDAVVFSLTDQESLEYVWNHFGSFDQFKLAELSHEYPEWKKHEAALSSESSSRLKMSFSDFLEDPVDGIDPCHALTEEEREVRREEVQELCSLHNLWN
ncbi:MAG: Panacea domain-containing protein [Verrucomicrobiota bacterium]